MKISWKDACLALPPEETAGKVVSRLPMGYCNLSAVDGDGPCGKGGRAVSAGLVDVVGHVAA